MDHVYWIRNAECTDIRFHGYIGVSKDPLKRFKQHLRNNSRIPNNSWLEIIFSGSRHECFKFEESLRPSKNIGWNRAVGGAQGFKKGFVHSDSVKEKMKAAWTKERRLAAAEIRRQQNALTRGQKRPKQSAAMTGELNPMFGISRSDDVKRKISEANIGKIPPNKQELYCVGCRVRASKHVLSRHTKCWTNYKSNKT